MLLASKYEEMFAPEIGDFVYITDNAYSKIKIRSMEQKILRAIEYDFSNPVCLNFLRRNSKAGAVCINICTLRILQSRRVPKHAQMLQICQIIYMSNLNFRLMHKNILLRNI